MHDAKRVRMKMLSMLLRNYGVAMTLVAVFLPILTGIEVPAWKEMVAVVVGLLLCGLAIYAAPFGEDEGDACASARDRET